MTMSARPAQDGRHEVADALLRVLVVAVGVHHDVGAVRERVLDAVREGAREAHGARVPHDVDDAVLARDLRPCGPWSRRR